jgi:predicted metal-dependent hydrolase
VRLVSQQQRTVSLAGQDVPYTLNRKLGRRGAGMKVDHRGLTINTGVSTAIGTIEDFIGSHATWVLHKLAEARNKSVAIPQFVDGEQLPFTGATVTLRLMPLAVGRTHSVLRDGELWVTMAAPTADKVRAAVTDRYKAEARRYFTERTIALCQMYVIHPPKVLLSSAMSRWGSCNSKREMRLNWRLIKAPLAEIDYVICHELAHLTHMNHSPAFWAEVSRLCPDWQRLRKALNAQDFRYRTF